jgi:hypothetical protein
MGSANLSTWCSPRQSRSFHSMHEKRPQNDVVLVFRKKLIGTEGARLLREKRVQGRTRRSKGAEGGPPAESECLEETY